jgi:hypothetical protein
MKTKVGLWIDHRKAVIVAVGDKGEEVKLIKSNVEKRIHPFGGSRSRAPHGPQGGPADDILEREFMGHLTAYFEEVVSCIRGADSILILGPGEAKGELKRRIERDGLSGRIVGVEKVDKMTDRQIVAKVRRRFRKGILQ